MNKKYDLFGIVLASVTGAVSLAMMLFRAFLPRIILPQFSASMLIAVTLIALVLERYITKGSLKRTYWLVPVYSLSVFGLFPWLACFLTYLEAIKFALLGAVIALIATVLFDSMMSRIIPKKATKAAPLAAGFGLFLAAQCLIGII